MENRVEAEGDFYSNRHSLNSVSRVRVMSKIQSHSTDSHSDDCMSLSVSVVSQRHGQSQRQRDTHSHRHSHSHRETVAAGFLLLYRNLPVSIPNSNYVYARRYFFAFWPPCCIRFQLVWPYLTSLSLDSIAYNAYRIKSAFLIVRHNYVKSGQCSRRHLKRILSLGAT